MKNFRKKLPQKKLYSEYVKIMNGIFGLSTREAEVFSFMLKLDSEWRPASAKDYKNILSPSNRSLISRECNIRKTNLSRLVTELRLKGLITINGNGGYEISKVIGLDIKDNIIEIVFTLEIIDEGTGQNN